MKDLDKKGRIHASRKELNVVAPRVDFGNKWMWKKSSKVEVKQLVKVERLQDERVIRDYYVKVQHQLDAHR